MINTLRTYLCGFVTQTFKRQQKYIGHRYISMQKERILLLDPFYGGSHKQLMDLLYEKIPGCLKITMTPKKWHWRARMAALHFSRTIPFSEDYEILFSSSVLNLTELVALRPDLSKLWKILYFHENQLAYPKQEEKPRDVQYGYNQILSCLVADKIVFNSEYNMESFLSNIDKFFKIMPDYRPKGIAEVIRPKCQVLYFPLNIQTVRKHAKPCRRVQTNRSCDTVDYDDLSSETAQDSNHGNSLISDDHNVKNILSNVSVSQIVDCSGNASEDLHDMKSSSSVIRSDLHEGSSETGIKIQPCTDQSTDSPLTNTSITGIDTEINGVQKQQDNFNSPTMAENNLLQNDYININDDSLKDNLDCNVSKRQKLSKSDDDSQTPLHIVWAHRWEYDKDPDTLFEVVFKLFDAGIPFTLSVMGEQYKDVPDVFTDAKHKLSSVIKAWGYQDNKEDYYDILAEADIVLSTAKHEFFGVAMLEAVYFGCYPLCPNRLVYPEIFPKTYLYNTPTQLYKKLRNFCLRPHLVRNHQCQVSVDKYLWENCHSHFTELFTTTK